MTKKGPKLCSILDQTRGKVWSDHCLNYNLEMLNNTTAEYLISLTEVDISYAFLHKLLRTDQNGNSKILVHKKRPQHKITFTFLNKLLFLFKSSSFSRSSKNLSLETRTLITVQARAVTKKQAHRAAAAVIAVKLTHDSNGILRHSDPAHVRLRLVWRCSLWRQLWPSIPRIWLSPQHRRT